MLRLKLSKLTALAPGVVLAAVSHAATIAGTPWPRHAVDATSQGADGTRLADVNGDGYLDITTGWEEGGSIRVYLNPGPEHVKDPWPEITVGSVKNPEDAVFVDLDGDGAMDVVSSCEGDTRTMFVHWAPSDPVTYRDAAAWRTEALPASLDQRQWMFCLPTQFDGVRGTDLVVGSKNADAAVGWFESPQNPRDLAAWNWHPLFEAGWIMSLVPVDMDGDGDGDILISDRRGDDRGCAWLERPEKPSTEWPRHRIGGSDCEVMFLTPGASESNAITTVLVAVSDTYLLQLHRDRPDSRDWTESRIPFPENTGTGKAVSVGDIDRDGTRDLVLSCENAKDAHGVFWLSGKDIDSPAYTEAHAISGVVGTKFDLVVLIDMDEDGDLDVLTCEERENLGVIWYENPAR